MGETGERGSLSRAGLDRSSSCNFGGDFMRPARNQFSLGDEGGEICPCLNRSFLMTCIPSSEESESSPPLFLSSVSEEK